MAGRSIELDYFHGYESEQFAFYRIPKILFTDEHFRELSSDAKVLYGLMLDRMALSAKNGWIDDQDRVYIIFTLDQIVECMNCGKDKGVKILAELDSKKGIGLIERVKQGQGKPALIYVKSFIGRENPAEVQTSEKPKSRVLESRSADFGKTEVQTSENPDSRLLENRSADFGKADTNNTYISNTDFNNTDLINRSGKKASPEMDESEWMDDEVRIYTELVKDNVEYDALMENCCIADRGYINDMVDLLVETISIQRKSVTVAGAEYPYQLVKSRLLKVGYEHILYVLDCLHKNTTKVYNIKAYLLTCLFNAPLTMNSYYRAEVNHDMYGTGGSKMDSFKDFFTKVIFPVFAVWLLVTMFLPVCSASGEVDYFLLWILVGCPFGIRKMFAWLVPSGFGIAGTVGVVALNFIIGGLIGGVVAVYRLVYAVFYTVKTVFALVTGR